MSSKNRIAFININNPQDKSLRSGVPYSIYQELSKEFDVVWIKTEITGIYSLLHQLVRVYEKIVRAMGYNPINNPFRSWLKGKSLGKKLEKNQYDAIFSTDSEDIAYLQTKLPIFYRTDALVHLMIDYYYFKVPWFARRWAMDVEENALKNMSIMFAPSQWVIDGVADFNIEVNSDKFILLESGANVELKDIKPKEHIYSLESFLNMIIIGYDLKRKGIDVAYETLRILNDEYRIRVTLTIIGGIPDDHIANDKDVVCIGKLDKNNRTEYIRFYQEFSNADLFLFPTKAECHGIVNCEAAAFALPIYSYRTGGVPSYCIDGVNGRTFELNMDGRDFAKAIFEDIRSGKMQSFSENSYQLSKEKFNWAVWGRTACEVIDNYITNKKHI